MDLVLAALRNGDHNLLGSGPICRSDGICFVFGYRPGRVFFK
jgi:hypothetical protein